MNRKEPPEKDPLGGPERRNSGPDFTDLLAAENRSAQAREIFEGLNESPKHISCRYFYDEAGTRLFDRITSLAEYYPTRTELEILKSHATDITGDFETLDIIDLGSGNTDKVSVLLEAIPADRLERVCYIPVDVSVTALRNSAEVLAAGYPGLRIHAVLADFMKHLDGIPGRGKKMFCFFGSTIGNLDKHKAAGFLAELENHMHTCDSLLLGFDMVKERKVLQEAYNDSQGVTAMFNRNILNAINRIAGTDFEPGQFEHRAVWNEQESRIEMYLEAARDMEIRSELIPRKIIMKAGERIHTENSHKYTVRDIEELSSAAGLHIQCIYRDPLNWFSVALLRTGG